MLEDVLMEFSEVFYNTIGLYFEQEKCWIILQAHQKNRDEVDHGRK
jgi:hypothetical protein